MSDKKTRTTNKEKVEKYNIQIPIALDKKETLEKLAKELDLSLAQYCRCVLLQHCKSENNIFSSNNVNNVKTTEIEKSETIIEKEQPQKPVKKAIKNGFGAK